MTFDHRKLIIVGASAALLAAVACERSNKAEQTQTTGAQQQGANEQQGASPNSAAKNENPSGGGPQGQGMNTPDPNQSVIQRVTQGRCQREMACGKIGAGKKWADINACEKELGQDTYDGLKQSECKTPNQAKVQKCLTALQSENCDNVRSGLSRIEACRQDMVCKE